MALHVSPVDVHFRDAILFQADAAGDQHGNLPALSRDVPPAAADAFSGSLSTASFTGIEIVKISASEHTVQRTNALIARTRGESILVNIQRSGCGVVRQDARSATLTPGDLAICTNARSYELLFDQPFSQTVLIVDRSALSATLPFDNITATVLAASAASARFVTAVAEALFLSAECAPEKTETLRTVLLLELASMVGVDPGDPGDPGEAEGFSSPGASEGRQFLVQRIKAHIARHLTDQTLCVASIAKAVNLSVAHVYRLFSGEPLSPSQWIQEHRLLAARDALGAPAGFQRPIGEIAAGCGYVDMSYFSRSFRRRFGMSPRECRYQAMAKYRLR